MSEKRALIVMAKRPAAGNTKTRLSPPLTLEDSAELYNNFLHDLIPKLQTLDNITIIIAHPGGDSAETYFNTLAPTIQTIPQIGDTLGDRLAYVIQHCFDTGYTQVSAVNSDSPTIPISYYNECYTSLDKPEIDAVFGPCEDGGYYLIGLKSPHPTLLSNIEMSTPHVLRDSLAEADQLGLTADLLPAWYDVDDADALDRLRAELDDDSSLSPNTHRFLNTL